MTPLNTLILCMMLAQSLFAAVPAIDLAVSGLFYIPGEGFWMAKEPALIALRRIGWNFGLLMLALLMMMTLAAALMRLRTPAAVWGYGVAAFLIGPALVVNGIFKAYWGRARPSQIIEFGGAAEFTPPMQLATECARNCSFVSGEGALAVTLSIVLWHLLSPSVSGHGRFWLGMALYGYAALLAGLRVAFGGHFLSDTIFSALICGFICLGLARLPWFRKATASPADMAADLRTVAALPFRVFRKKPSRRAGST